VSGADRVARLVLGLLRVGGAEGRVEPAFYNGSPALVLYLGDSLEGVITVEITDGRISHFYAMRNPDKLGGVRIAREISR
jgi:RNA polymerase sigma-70 factor (ECF subfamily)